uniref:Putative THUMP domain-containing protein 1 isoform X1 n=1 Tax=Davidia involucrata TaxID=16924 RepID=A0A5B7ASC3_DAVIN
MATENKSKSSNGETTNRNSKKRRHRYLPHNKSVKKKGSYPLRPGVEGFFITCDGGRERQASHEAINVIDSFYEELVHGKDSCVKLAELPSKPLNRKTKFTYSDSSSSDDNDDGADQKDEEAKGKLGTQRDSDANPESLANEKSDPHKEDGVCCENQIKEDTENNKEEAKCQQNQAVEAEEPQAKKQCLETDASKCGNVIRDKMEEKSVDRLIEAELKELGDKSKRRFNNLDSGCNGVVFVQMRKRDGDPGPKDIVQHMMTSLASTRKHMSRFMLRVLPVEVTCYASEEEIANAIKPLIAQYFPSETQTPHKFAVLYEARANTGIDRMTIINAVAKSVPGPHKVDLSNPDKNIIIEIVKTVCLIGVVEKYKEMAKYNLRQLTSSKP